MTCQVGRVSNIIYNKFDNSAFDGKQYHEQQQNVNISLDKIGEHMREAAKIESNLKEQTEKLRNTNEELEKVRENYKAVTEKVQKVALEHPVPETENQAFHHIEKDLQEVKEMLQKQKDHKNCQIL